MLDKYILCHVFLLYIVLTAVLCIWFNIQNHSGSWQNSSFVLMQNDENYIHCNLEDTLVWWNLKYLLMWEMVGSVNGLKSCIWLLCWIWWSLTSLIIDAFILKSFIMHFWKRETVCHIFYVMVYISYFSGRYCPSTRKKRGQARSASSSLKKYEKKGEKLSSVFI